MRLREKYKSRAHANQHDINNDFKAWVICPCQNTAEIGYISWLTNLLKVDECVSHFVKLQQSI